MRNIGSLSTRLRGNRVLKVMATLVLRGLGSGLAVLVTVLVTRYLDTASAASFLLVFNMSTIAAVCFRWGLDDVIVRRVAASTVPERISTSRRLMRFAHKRVATWAAASSIATVIIYFLPSDWNPLDRSAILFAIAISALVALASCAGRIYQGANKTNYAAVVLNVAIPGALVLGLLVLTTANVSLDAFILQILYVSIAAASYLLFVWGNPLARPHIKRAPQPHLSTLRSADEKAANRLGGVVLAHSGLNWWALILIPVAYNDELFTKYMVSYKVAVLMTLVMLAVNFTFASRLASLYAQHDLVGLKKLANFMVMVVAVTSAAMACLIFGLREYVYAFAGVGAMDVVLALLIAAQGLFAVASVYVLILSMCHEETFLLTVQGILTSVGIVAFTAMSFHAPLEIATLVFVVAYAILAAVLGYRVRKLLTQ